MFSWSLQSSTLKCISTLRLALPAESNPTDIITQYVTIFMQLPTSCTLTTGNGLREYLMHILIRQQQSSDMFQTQFNYNVQFFFSSLSREYGNLTWCNVYAHLRKNVQTILYSRKSRYLKIYVPPVDQNVQYFQKSKFSDIKYCIFQKADCLHSILLNKIKLFYIRTFKA